VCIIAVRTSEGESVATAGNGFIIPSFNAALIIITGLVAPLAGGADGAGGVVLLA
jgi:hypothetical protein